MGRRPKQLIEPVSAVFPAPGTVSEPIELSPAPNSASLPLRHFIPLPVTRADIEARIAVCEHVAVHAIRAGVPPSDRLLTACLSELDALARIIPTKGD